jgi:hypothetical protein
MPTYRSPYFHGTGVFPGSRILVLSMGPRLRGDDGEIARIALI